MNKILIIIPLCIISFVGFLIFKSTEDAPESDEEVAQVLKSSVQLNSAFKKINSGEEDLEYLPPDELRTTESMIALFIEESKEIDKKLISNSLNDEYLKKFQSTKLRGLISRMQSIEIAKNISEDDKAKLSLLIEREALALSAEDKEQLLESFPSTLRDDRKDLSEHVFNLITLLDDQSFQDKFYNQLVDQLVSESEDVSDKIYFNRALREYFKLHRDSNDNSLEMVAKAFEKTNSIDEREQIIMSYRYAHPISFYLPSLVGHIFCLLIFCFDTL